MHILIVEDDNKIADTLKDGLQREGYDVSTSYTGEEGYFLASTQKFDLLLLDIMLPGRSGIEILQSLRQNCITLPVLMLTAKDSIEDRVIGLDCGADDYLVKPFAFPELLARIRALTRRGRPENVLRLQVDDLHIDCVTQKVDRGGNEIILTGLEYKLLEYLMRHQGAIVSREMLSRHVWELQQREDGMDNVINVTVNRLRSKIDTPFSKQLLTTVRGIGFRLGDAS